MDGVRPLPTTAHELQDSRAPLAVGRFRWRDATRRYFDADADADAYDYDDLYRQFSVLRQAGSRSRRAPAA
jgi:hypothetical protein